mgnify:CR=1 FL=1
MELQQPTTAVEMLSATIWMALPRGRQVHLPCISFDEEAQAQAQGQEASLLAVGGRHRDTLNAAHPHALIYVSLTVCHVYIIYVSWGYTIRASVLKPDTL